MGSTRTGSNQKTLVLVISPVYYSYSPIKSIRIHYLKVLFSGGRNAMDLWSELVAAEQEERNRHPPPPQQRREPPIAMVYTRKIVTENTTTTTTTQSDASK